jgi:hypothetical protein
MYDKLKERAIRRWSPPKFTERVAVGSGSGPRGGAPGGVLIPSVLAAMLAVDTAL